MTENIKQKISKTLKGRHVSPNTEFKKGHISCLRNKEINLAEKNGMWKGNKVKKRGIHPWIRRRLPQPPNCEICNKKTKQLDLANISQKYLRRLDDWEYLCRRCHMEKDGRKNNLIKISTIRYKKPCQCCQKMTTGHKFCKDCLRIKQNQKRRLKRSLT